MISRVRQPLEWEQKAVGWEAGSGDSGIWKEYCTAPRLTWEPLVGRSSKKEAGWDGGEDRTEVWGRWAGTAPSRTSHGSQRVRFFLWKQSIDDQESSEVHPPRQSVFSMNSFCWVERLHLFNYICSS